MANTLMHTSQPPRAYVFGEGRSRTSSTYTSCGVASCPYCRLPHGTVKPRLVLSSMLRSAAVTLLEEKAKVLTNFTGAFGSFGYDKRALSVARIAQRRGRLRPVAFHGERFAGGGVP